MQYRLASASTKLCAGKITWALLLIALHSASSSPASDSIQYHLRHEASTVRCEQKCTNECIASRICAMHILLPEVKQHANIDSSDLKIVLEPESRRTSVGMWLNYLIDAHRAPNHMDYLHFQFDIKSWSGNEKAIERWMDGSGMCERMQRRTETEKRVESWNWSIIICWNSKRN